MSASDTAETHRAFIALGSNIDPKRFLPEAVHRLKELGRLARISAVYESPPADGSSQPNYFNAAVLLLTALSAEKLCREFLPAIEAELGRVRDPSDRNAPRTIDLDLALYDDDVLTIDHRRIPDPEIADRSFLAIPLSELDAAYRHPESDRTLLELASLHKSCRTLQRRDDVSLTAANPSM